MGIRQIFPVKADTVVLPDDTIVVAEGKRFYVSGEVKTPGRYLYEKGLTVHKAITMVGGLRTRRRWGGRRFYGLWMGRSNRCG